MSCKDCKHFKKAQPEHYAGQCQYVVVGDFPSWFNNLGSRHMNEISGEDCPCYEKASTPKEPS